MIHIQHQFFSIFKTIFALIKNNNFKNVSRVVRVIVLPQSREFIAVRLQVFELFSFLQIVVRYDKKILHVVYEKFYDA